MNCSFSIRSCRRIAVAVSMGRWHDIGNPMPKHVIWMEGLAFILKGFIFCFSPVSGWMSSNRPSTESSSSLSTLRQCPPPPPPPPPPQLRRLAARRVLESVSSTSSADRKTVRGWMYQSRIEASKKKAAKEKQKREAFDREQRRVPVY